MLHLPSAHRLTIFKLITEQKLLELEENFSCFSMKVYELDIQVNCLASWNVISLLCLRAEY